MSKAKSSIKQINGRECAGSDFHLALSVKPKLARGGFAPRHLKRYVSEGHALELIAITDNGEATQPLTCLPPAATEMVEATTQLYRAVGYEPPWIGYLAVENGDCVGMCAFKSPPQNNRVEIAYFTFPEYESRGVATRMAAELIRLALQKMPAVIVAAQTLPEENASTSILKKLRFRLIGTLEHPEDGLVWEWQLNDTAEA